MLRKFDIYYPNYKDPFGGSTIRNVDVYAANDEKVGLVKNILVDEETGRFRLLIVETGLEYVGRQVLIPAGLVQLDHKKQCIRISQLAKQQITDLPDFAGELRNGSNYEEKISHIYASLTSSVGIYGTKYSLPHSEIYDRLDYLNANGSFHEYEELLMAQHYN
ncbi:PRC-barrel domain-containing protein [Leptolyngbya sp. AN03gr2]|uniref:PRC-barrel domain-containing protein n=1 Tax=unclassified Leptolyngbya TaxID=2650499 RepID=UPI003D3220CC